MPHLLQTRYRTLILIAAVGFVLRVWLSTTQDAWIDEAFSLQFMARLPLRQIWDAAQTQDSHPPLYYVALHLWLRLVGFGVFQARLLSVLAGTACILVLYDVADLLLDRTTAHVAAALLAISPVSVWYSDEIRMFMLADFFGLAALCAVIRATRSPVGSCRRWWIAYSLLSALAVSSDSSGVYLVAAANLYALTEVLAGRVRAGLWIAANLLAFVLAAPSLAVLRYQAIHSRGQFGWITEPTLETVWHSMVDLVSMNGNLGVATAVGAGLLLIGLSAGVLDSCRGRRPEAWLLVGLMTVVPLAVPLVVSVVVPVFLTRTILSAVFGLLLLFAYALVALFRRRVSLGLLALAIVLFLNCQSLWAVASRPLKEDWQGLAHYAANHLQQDSIVVIDPSWLRYGFELYWQPHNRPETMDDGSVDASAAVAGKAAAAHQSIWLIVGYLPANSRGSEGAAYLRSHQRLVNMRRFFGGLMLYHYLGSPPGSSAQAGLPSGP